MQYFYHSRRNHKQRPKTPRTQYHYEPTLAHIAQRDRIVQIAKWYKGRHVDKLCAKLAELGHYPTDKRIYKSGGVGSWYWLPKLGVFRVQVRASHITTKGQYMPYALCVDV